MFSKLKVMFFGDSITVGTGYTGPGGYRVTLLSRIRLRTGFIPQACGWSRTGNFGNNFSCATSGDRAEELLADALLQVPAFIPDVCFIHIGTNDATQRNSGLWSGTVNDTINSIEDILDIIRSTNQRAKVFIAKIIPNQTAGADTYITQQNAAMQTMLDGRADYAAGLVEVVDMNAIWKQNVNWATDYMSDTTHPNRTGYENVMADAWADAFEAWWGVHV